MPTDTFPITSAANDGTGQVFQDPCFTWPPTGSFTDESDDPTNELFASKGKSGNYWFYENAFMRWDTSTIDDAATITAANLLIYVTSKHDDDGTFSIVGDYYDFGGEPTVVGDMVQTASPSIFTAVDIGSGITTGAVNTIALTDLTGITKTGFTGIRLTASTGEPGGGNIDGINVAAFEHANQEPRLEVTYTVPPTNNATVAWITA